MKILIAEDDRETADYLSQGLIQHGHVVTAVHTGREALFCASEEPFDVLVLDRMLPGVDGLTVLKMLRAGGIRVPALMLTAKSKIAERVEALENGADDYLIKPFAFSELHARLNLIARRPASREGDALLKVLDVELDLHKRILRRAGRRIELQPKEILLLECLMRNAHRVMTRTMLLERVWDFDFDPQTNIVETHISRIRAKLNAGFDIDAIITVRRSGYMIRSE